jgi:hypothetical protein
MTQQEIDQVLALLNSGEWWYEYGEHRVIKAEVRRQQLCIETENQSMVLKIVIEDGERQTLFSGNPEYELCFIAKKAEMDMREPGRTGAFSHTFRHRERWEAVALARASQELNTRLGLPNREITGLQLEGTTLTVVRGQESTSVKLDCYENDYGDLVFYLPADGSSVPIDMDQLLWFGKLANDPDRRARFKELAGKFHGTALRGE